MQTARPLKNEALGKWHALATLKSDPGYEIIWTSKFQRPLNRKIIDVMLFTIYFYNIYSTVPAVKVMIRGV